MLIILATNPGLARLGVWLHALHLLLVEELPRGAGFGHDTWLVTRTTSVQSHAHRQTKNHVYMPLPNGGAVRIQQGEL